MSSVAAGSEAFTAYSFDALDYRERYKLVLGSVIPRPVAFVSSLNAAGKANLAPFSNFMVISSPDGLLAFSVGADRPGEGEEKDTLRNVRARKEYVINTVSTALAAQVQACSEAYAPEVSEAETLGIALLPSQKVSAPRVAEAKVHFECRLHSINPFGIAHLVVGQVVCIHVRNDILDDFKVDPRKYSPLGRIAGRTYCSLGEMIDV